jgi:hypothetical protein
MNEQWAEPSSFRQLSMVQGLLSLHTTGVDLQAPFTQVEGKQKLVVVQVIDLN